MKLAESKSYICRTIESLYPLREARRIADILLKDLLGFGATDMILHGERELSSQEELQLRQATARIAAWEPIQYVTGQAEFCGLRLEVNPSVLIPRGETEELVEWIVIDLNSASNNTPQTILDIGTGSGAIAIALTQRIANAQLVAVDASPDALSTARGNAVANKAEVRFAMADILQPRWYDYLQPPLYDVVVSNPPYIPLEQRPQMRHNVTDYEPSMALFVPDDDPLLFYRAIASAGRDLLHDNGTLYFEIHEAFADPIEQLLNDMHYIDIELRHDLNRKPRMIKARKA